VGGYPRRKAKPQLASSQKLLGSSCSVVIQHHTSQPLTYRGGGGRVGQLGLYDRTGLIVVERRDRILKR